MKTIDDIIFDNKYDSFYAENSDGSGSSSGWEYSQVVEMLKEYAEIESKDFVKWIRSNNYSSDIDTMYELYTRQKIGRMK